MASALWKRLSEGMQKTTREGPHEKEDVREPEVKCSHGNIEFTSTTQYFTRPRYSYQQSSLNNSRDILLILSCPLCFTNIYILSVRLWWQPLRKNNNNNVIMIAQIEERIVSKSIVNQIQHIQPAVCWLIHEMGSATLHGYGRTLTPSRRCREVVRVRFYVDLIVTDHLNED